MLGFQLVPFALFINLATAIPFYTRQSPRVGFPVAIALTAHQVVVKLSIYLSKSSSEEKTPSNTTDVISMINATTTMTPNEPNTGTHPYNTDDHTDGFLNQYVLRGWMRQFFEEIVNDEKLARQTNRSYPQKVMDALESYVPQELKSIFELGYMLWSQLSMAIFLLSYLIQALRMIKKTFSSTTLQSVSTILPPPNQARPISATPSHPLDMDHLKRLSEEVLRADGINHRISEAEKVAIKSNTKIQQLQEGSTRSCKAILQNVSNSQTLLESTESSERDTRSVYHDVLSLRSSSSATLSAAVSEAEIRSLEISTQLRRAERASEEAKKCLQTTIAYQEKVRESMEAAVAYEQKAKESSEAAAANEMKKKKSYQTAAFYESIAESLAQSAANHARTAYSNVETTIKLKEQIERLVQEAERRVSTISQPISEPQTIREPQPSTEQLTVTATAPVPRRARRSQPPTVPFAIAEPETNTEPAPVLQRRARKSRPSTTTQQPSEPQTTGKPQPIIQAQPTIQPLPPTESLPSAGSQLSTEPAGPAGFGDSRGSVEGHGLAGDADVGNDTNDCGSVGGRGTVQGGSLFVSPFVCPSASVCPTPQPVVSELSRNDMSSIAAALKAKAKGSKRIASGTGMRPMKLSSRTVSTAPAPVQIEISSELMTGMIQSAELGAAAIDTDSNGAVSLLAEELPGLSVFIDSVPAEQGIGVQPGEAESSTMSEAVSTEVEMGGEANISVEEENQQAVPSSLLNLAPVVLVRPVMATGVASPVPDTDSGPAFSQADDSDSDSDDSIFGDLSKRATQIETDDTEVPVFDYEPLSFDDEEEDIDFGLLPGGYGGSDDANPVNLPAESSKSEEEEEEKDEITRLVLAEDTYSSGQDAPIPQIPGLSYDSTDEASRNMEAFSSNGEDAYESDDEINIICEDPPANEPAPANVEAAPLQEVAVAVAASVSESVPAPCTAAGSRRPIARPRSILNRVLAKAPVDQNFVVRNMTACGEPVTLNQFLSQSLDGEVSTLSPTWHQYRQIMQALHALNAPPPPEYNEEASYSEQWNEEIQDLEATWDWDWLMTYPWYFERNPEEILDPRFEAFRACLGEEFLARVHQINKEHLVATRARKAKSVKFAEQLEK